MALYSRAMDLRLAMPTPMHALAPAAVEAVESMRLDGHARKVERRVSSLVTTHGHQRVKPHNAPPSAGYRTVKRLAEAKGFTVTEYRSATGHALQGVRGDVGFRAYWHWGKTAGATWHEREARWTLVDDPRPVKVNATARVGLKGYRAAGIGHVHLHLLAAPWGMSINVTELEARLEAS